LALLTDLCAIEQFVHAMYVVMKMSRIHQYVVEIVMCGNRIFFDNLLVCNRHIAFCWFCCWDDILS